MTTYKFFMCAYFIVAIISCIDGANTVITLSFVILSVVCKATSDILEAVRKVNNKL